MSRVTFSIATVSNAGAIGIIQLYGPGVIALIEKLTRRAASRSRSFLADLGGIDEGLVVVLRSDWAQLMPHGGPRVMQRLSDRLRELGAEWSQDPPARLVYPEADSDIEADMLEALARAASPAAIDLLIDQPRLWREVVGNDWAVVRNDPRDHLITPPSVVLIGRPNVGKSTLTNLVLGRAASLTADLPGTTRDWVAGLAELPTPIGGLAVRWFDTPGMRQTADPIEQRGIELAGGVIEAADVLIAVRDPDTDWPPLTCERQPDLRVTNKSDLLNGSSLEPQASSLQISALTGQGLDDLAAAVYRALHLDRIALDSPWAFSAELRRIVREHDRRPLDRYLSTAPAAGPAAGPAAELEK